MYASWLQQPHVTAAVPSVFQTTRLPVGPQEPRPPAYPSTCQLPCSQVVPVEPGSPSTPSLANIQDPGPQRSPTNPGAQPTLLLNASMAADPKPRLCEPPEPQFWLAPADQAISCGLRLSVSLQGLKLQVGDSEPRLLARVTTAGNQKRAAIAILIPEEKKVLKSETVTRDK